MRRRLEPLASREDGKERELVDPTTARSDPAQDLAFEEFLAESSLSELARALAQAESRQDPDEVKRLKEHAGKRRLGGAKDELRRKAPGWLFLARPEVEREYSLLELLRRLEGMKDAEVDPMLLRELLSRKTAKIRIPGLERLPGR